MFEMGARDHPPEQVYHDYVKQSDVFVGVYWQSYGWLADGSAISGIEDELRLAGDMPRLIYIKEPAPERDPRLAGLLEQIQRSGVATKEISGPEDLGDHVTTDIALLLSDRFSSNGRSLPSGTVTFLFADVEGSTAALERIGDDYAELLGLFRRDCETLISGAGGMVVKTEGDGVFGVFTDAGSAVGAAITAQHTFLSYPYPGPLKVRMGLHSGAGIVVDDDYAGIDVHRAARVGSAAHGGQILISSPTRELVRGSEVAAIADLGWFELKGLARPEHLHQVTGPGLPSEFPSVRAQPSYRARLPRQLTTLFGRERDVEEVAAQLASGVRLITLIGPGGIGKTRLAVAVAERVEARFSDSVGFVALAAVSDGARVAETIAAALGRTLEGTVSGEEVIVDELRDRRFLLILDNFEQVADSAPLVRDLLERLPQLQIMVTSRLALQLSVEREYAVVPLELPQPGSVLDEIAESAAVRLLLDRARAARPDLSINEDNAAAMAELVRRLDGIPLAIEIVAARLRLMSPADVVSRLKTALDLGEGAVDLPARQRTLRATIDWSNQLLSPSDQVLFSRLGVFIDGWTLEAAEAVVGGSEVGDVAAGLDALAAHSLIRLETILGAGVRMRLLGPLQDYASEVLERTGELEAVRERHARYFGRRVEEYPRNTGAGLSDWQRRMDLEWGNIRQAILWCVRHSDFHGLAGLLAAMWPLLWLEDRVDESLGWLAVLRPNLDVLPRPLRAQMIYVDGFFALEVGDFKRALEAAQQAITEAVAVGDEELEGRARLQVAGALPAFDLNDPLIGEYIVSAISTFRRRADMVNLAYALNFQCSYQAAMGNLDTARKSIEEALLLSRAIEAIPLEAQSSSALAFVELLQGNLDGAEEQLAAAVKALTRTPSREVMTYVLDGYGWWALAKGREIAGLTALGAAEGLRARVGLRTWPLTTAQIAVLAAMADSYEDPEAQAARRAGRELSPEAALAVVTGGP